EAGPSIPVQILGLSGVPESGDDFVVVADERLAREVAAERAQKRRDTRMVSKANRLEDIIAQMGQGAAMQTLNILVKADVQGSVQALRESLSAIGNENVKVNVIAAGVGGLQGAGDRLQRACRCLGTQGDRYRRFGRALFLDHLRRDRPGEAGGVRPARR